MKNNSKQSEKGKGSKLNNQVKVEEQRPLQDSNISAAYDELSQRIVDEEKKTL